MEQCLAQNKYSVNSVEYVNDEFVIDWMIKLGIRKTKLISEG